MAVCLDYQSVYLQRRGFHISSRVQIAVACLVLSVLGLKVWISVEHTRIGYQLAEEQELAMSYDLKRREIELQHSILLRPDNLSALAKERLGLAPLRVEQARKLSID